MSLTPVDSGIKERMKLGSVLWVVQEKLGLNLYWDKETLLMPLESRNSIRLDTGYSAPEGWDGRMWLSSYGFSLPPLSKQKAFFLTLDFDR